MKTIYCPDIECESCEKLISKKLSKNDKIKKVEFSQDSIRVDGDVNSKDIIKEIETLGFRASENPFSRKTLGERIRHFKENKHLYKIERKAFFMFFKSLGLILILELLAYLGFFIQTPNFISKYGIWLIYLALSVASISTALWHFYSYKTNISCMMGMMIGMTVGMQTGMLIGAIIGATNGFFIGALVGMLVSVAVGIISGQCCGVMGVLEGMMAGVMGGTMGPMITVMMFSDGLNVFMPFYVIINILIMLGMIYMFFEESVEGKAAKIRKISPQIFYGLLIIITAVLIAIMTYGPKSPLLA